MKIPRWLSISLVCLFTLSGSFYYFVVKPTIDVENAAPLEIPKAVNSFHECWGRKDLESCRPQMTDVMANSLGSFFDAIDPFTNKLGKRLTGEMQRESIRVHTNASVTGEGTVTTVSVTYRTMYEKDVNVQEHYIFLTQRKPGDYKIHAFRVNSQEFGK